VAASLFAVLAVLQVWLAVRTRAWWMLPVPITACFEVLGYAARAQMAFTDASRNAFITMQCTLIISPVLLAISECVKIVCGPVLTL
jgi:hypothetical protein